MPEPDSRIELDLDNLFSVAHVEVVQQLDIRELKAVIQHLVQELAVLGHGPRAEDLQQSIQGLREEVTALRTAHEQSLSELKQQQVRCRGLLPCF